ncbi:dynein heavy chain [Grosmannia clavigera kw1407]|uniref:Dynein heavy chain, cytoplasmic n=1 Tax=Grosmannia clavigera (strain kw1407 / UAMH 11150) TaxID=655863 RepID=F0X971_GROCL|nr:dynein heavy chain [Grosmannia clavigera kw1407]EFX05210.1 dynein heavy chain [Grosmannia clavigera kw1407]
MEIIAPSSVAGSSSLGGIGSSGGGVSPSATAGTATAPSYVDPTRVIEHLTAVLEAALGATRDELEAPGSLLSKSRYADTVQRCSRFAHEPQVVSLYIQKDVLPARIDEDKGTPSPPQHLFTLAPDLSAETTTVAFLVLLKRPQPLDPNVPITSQVQMLNLPGPAYLTATAGEQGLSTSPFEILQLYLHNGLAPYFDASTKPAAGAAANGTSRGRADLEAKTGVPVTKKRWTELELSLAHLQQNVEIPEVVLPFPPIVQNALDDASGNSTRPSFDQLPPGVTQDTALLNSLQATVNTWIKSIQVVTKMTQDPTTGTANQEINYWLSMESALERIEAQLRGDGVSLTLDILKHAKRFQATVSFVADTGLKEAMERVQKYNQLMRDFPLDELLSATALAKVEDSIVQIFSHLNKKLRICPYPIRRALALVESISSDLDDTMHRLLSGTELVDLDYAEFNRVMSATNDIFRAWDDNVKEFTNVAREVTRRRNDKFIPIKINPRHAQLQARLKYIQTFRENHEQLQRTIVTVLGPTAANAAAGDGADGSAKAANGTNGPSGVNSGNGGAFDETGDMDAVEEVRQAWEALRNVDLLDVTPEGTAKWARAENAYNERTARVENSIIARLRDRLATAKNANEMFRVFSKFNALFVRPKIRGAIAEYQTQLIDNVKQAIAALHERFKQQYGHSEAHAMATLHDLPPVSGAIIWARQIERQLDNYMKKVEDVLGADWALHAEGQKLQNESVQFRNKLKTVPIFEAWARDTMRREVSIAGRLFSIKRVRAAGNKLELGVNFDPQVIALFKETRNLIWLNYSVPHAVTTVAKDAKRVYPYAVSLMESVRTFAQTLRAINEMPEVSMLLNGHRNDVYSLVAKGVPLRWESFVNSYEVHLRGLPHMPNGNAMDRLKGGESRHVLFVREIAAAVSLLQTKTATLATYHATIQKSLKELATCPYNANAFETRLRAIQEAVDQLNLQQYANLGFWVEGMNRQIKATLLTRLQRAILAWIEAFENDEAAEPNKTKFAFGMGFGGGSGGDEERRRPVTAAAAGTADATVNDVPTMKHLVHEVTMRNQLIYLDPPLEFARASWYLRLHEWLGVTCNLRKIKATSYEMRLGTTVVEDARFNDLPAECTTVLLRVQTSIETKLGAIGSYVDEWLRFQSLWDLQSEKVYDLLGDQLSRWLQLLQEIRKTRQTFDTTEVSRSFGHITIDYDQVQTKVNAKYDQWQHDILLKFAGRLGGRMREVYAEIEKARTDLETLSLEVNSTAHAVQFITIVQACKRHVKVWAPEIETFRQGESTLVRQRYQFPNDWLHAQQVDHEWNSLNELLSRKAKIVQDQTDALRAKIIAEDAIVADKIAEIAVQWNEEKPVSGTIAPEVATATLAAFEGRITTLQGEAAMVAKAKEALDLAAAAETSLNGILEEVQDFKSVWASLSLIWKNLSEQREMLWNSVQPRKVRASIDNLIKMTRDMPSRMRQYAAFEHIQERLRTYVRVNPLLGDLKSEAVRDRHWTKIYKQIRPGKRYSPVSMTLGDVWDLNLVATEAIIRDIVAQAQGEMALEEFLKQVRETWTSYSLELVNYQNKCRLIRGWDELFAKCSENLNSLQAMRHSPYYKEFEEEASGWEDKLNRVHILFDVWIDVQRQWVYLEGVFTGNADIKHLLPIESSRFQNINSEFSAVMKKMYKQPYVLDVLNIPNVQKSLERLAELLNKIQKALGEYLEKERVSFPRFYFVGDEDLLEMIGNSNDTVRVAKHFKKMFAGLSGLVMGEDEAEAVITAFSSKEGEVVRLKRSISLIKTPRINDWLALLEGGMKQTLAELLGEAIAAYGPVFAAETVDPTAMEAFLEGFPSQIVVLATQAVWTTAVDAALADEKQAGAALQRLFEREVQVLRLLAAMVLGDLDVLVRRKCEQLITECVHQRDIIEKLVAAGADSPTHHLWLLQMRYVYTSSSETEAQQRLSVRMANATLQYGFEYLGVPDRLVRTPLTDRCFLTLTQALCQQLGGSPYGPAGTGKTESVKALGVELGRFTLVFCCDDTFDFQAMGRIFLGICQVGAWGCFDEFNRLEERILSAVSQQIQNIQLGLRQGAEDDKAQIELVGRQLRVNGNTGIFITMNPGYAGRSNLPDNLKKLFRSVAMSKPDKELIAEVMLYSQGFGQAKALSKQTVPFFDQCAAELSRQAHYDFGLRALKSVLVSSGGLKRARLTDGRATTEAASLGEVEAVEPEIIVQSIRETIAPKLIKADVAIMGGIEARCFPGVRYVPANLEALETAVRRLAGERQLVVNETWLTKVLQLYQIQRMHHGVMMVGSAGSGKSTAWRLLLEALQQVEKVEGVCHVIDSKVMSKEALYGNLDATTREWTDGLFTSILRKIVDNLRGEDGKRHWIVFDGDVDPEWVENLNSVLDDNKLLTLPNGERLNLPANVRIMFEVADLRYATLATVSRCGMVWFSEDTVTPAMVVDNYLGRLAAVAFEDLDEDAVATGQSAARALAVQTQAAELLRSHLTTDDFVLEALNRATTYRHIMDFTAARALNTLFSLVNKAVRNVIEYNAQHADFALEPEQVEAYLSKKLLLAMVWALTGDCPLEDRQAFGDVLVGLAGFGVAPPAAGGSVIDFDVSLPRAEWTSWQAQVPSVEVNTHSVTQTDVVIPTLDTVRHEDVLYSWLAEHKPLLLCGPPGSGKTMTLFSALRKLPNMEVVGLNFSSATTPDLLIKSFEQYCEYKKTLSGVLLSPTQIGRWLVVFCDEINLPAPDRYGTQRAIAFLRQLVEHNGFWRASDKAWVTLDRIQFVGACNPPTDAGRTPLGARFLRHAPLMMVDYPGEQSLQQIYGTFNAAVLKIIPTLRGYAEALTQAMVRLYTESQQRFTAAQQAHYVYSPRELTRWVRGVYEAIRPLEALSVEGLVRIWAHEALRLFQDRLVEASEREWTEAAVRRIALELFPNVDEAQALGGPILFSNWLSKHYVPVDREQLRDFVKARLRTFCEEEVDVPLILFNDVLEHVLRIDRVFRQPQGHLILIGVSGSGKTTLSRFVAWMNGLKVFQIKVHGKYSAEDFDEDLREVLRRCGCKGEKMCFIMDEANVLDAGFLERMNTLLANAEVPGLFEGDDLAALMTACKEGAQRQGLHLDSQEELYKWFTGQIVKNLHVVFTMNPPAGAGGLSSRAATSPALFNRCVLNWFGDWSDQALFQVAHELTGAVDLERAQFVAPDTIPVAYAGLTLPASHRGAVVNAMVYVHHSLRRVNGRLQQQQGRTTFLTPRHFLDFVAQYVRLYGEKREDLEEQQRHLNVGLEKLRDTVDKVRDLRASLASKQAQLERKDAEANEKLQRMVADQREAEQRKSTSLEIQAALEVQDAEVATRRQAVLEDLARAEPAVEAAKASVSNIKRQQLTEVRAMASPPAGVRLALDSVCTLLGHRAGDWKTIQSVIRRDDFIASIINFNNEKMMTKALRVKMRSEFLSNPEFTFDRVNRASKACGPLVQWVEAQVSYGEILDRVGPLREEVAALAEQALQTRAQARAVEQTIDGLEASIATYKTEYAALISETQAIKAEMARVQHKVDRSVRLLDSLSSERVRWEEGSRSFETQIGTLVGDVLVAAAFLAYGGLYDQTFRRAMVDDWLQHLRLSGIATKPHNPVTEYLSTADERLGWQANALPADDLCTENAIILRRFNRYPLIIDPSGRATEFLQRECRGRRLTVTSFLDDAFAKQLESALRFGNPILIQDAEHLDPVLNHVLNKEYQKTGGRVLIQLGRQQIDFSPAFRLYLATRDPSATFAPDICSRTTLVNFTVTQSSLRTQALNEVLRAERPDVDERRSNLTRLQGEFKVHLRQLEKRLLQALNESRGNILDDDHVIETLETLKTEAADISDKMRGTEGVMADVDAVTRQYAVVARSCSAVFAVLEQLHYLHHFYQFSLDYFLDIFHAVLQRASAAGTVVATGASDDTYNIRRDAIVRDLFVTTFQRTALGLLQKDRITLAMLLVQASPYAMDKSLIDVLLDDDGVPGRDVSGMDGRDEAIALARRLPALQQQVDGISEAEWARFLGEELAENFVPPMGGGESNEERPNDERASDSEETKKNDEALRSLLMVKLFRLDRFVPAAERFAALIFGTDDLFDIVEDLGGTVAQVPATRPVALVSSPGFDASYKVDGLAARTGARCSHIAMGSAEGLASADKAVSSAAQTGAWVLVKNVHLAPTWLQSLEKRMETLHPHGDFRLFLSMESSPRIPVNLLRASRVLLYEQPAGVRANMKDSLASLAPRCVRPPAERTRLYLLLSFLHAVVQERLRYAPTLGWKGFWEFNDSDYECSAFVVDTWLAAAAGQRSNIAPQNIPWAMIRQLVTETYGGKIDNEDDFALLRQLVDRVLSPAAYDIGHRLLLGDLTADAADTDALVVPSGTALADCMAWIQRLPEREPPTYLGLPANAEKVLLVGLGRSLVQDLRKVTNLLDEGEQLIEEERADDSHDSLTAERIVFHGQPGHAGVAVHQPRLLFQNPDDPVSYVCAWLALVPQGLCVVYATLLWSTREAEVALAFAGQLGCEAVNLVLKRLIKEERPRHHHTALGLGMALPDPGLGNGPDADQLHHLPFRRGYGMPSSHAQFAGYWAVTIALFLLVRYRGQNRIPQNRQRQESPQNSWSLAERVATSTAAFVVAVLVAWSRVYLHYHTPRQVLVGFAAGLLVGFAWFAATTFVRRCGLLRWVLALPPARWLRIRDLAAEEDAPQAGWEKWLLLQAARETQLAQAAAKKT